ncbi:hypothetical protein D9M71_807830 [compost metagenome]
MLHSGISLHRAQRRRGCAEFLAGSLGRFSALILLTALAFLGVSVLNRRNRRTELAITHVQPTQGYLLKQAQHVHLGHFNRSRLGALQGATMDLRFKVLLDGIC